MLRLAGALVVDLNQFFAMDAVLLGTRIHQIGPCCKDVESYSLVCRDDWASQVD